MSRRSRWIEAVALGIVISGGSVWLAGESHAEQRVNADRIVILSDDIDKKTTSVTHSQEQAGTPNDGGSAAPGADLGSQPETPAIAAKPAKPEKPAKPKKPKKPKKPAKPGKR